MKKIIEMFYEDVNVPTKRKENPYWNGIIIVLEDGTRLQQNVYEGQCLVPFTKEQALAEISKENSK